MPGLCSLPDRNDPLYPNGSPVILCTWPDVSQQHLQSSPAAETANGQDLGCLEVLFAELSVQVLRSYHAVADLALSTPDQPCPSPCAAAKHHCCSARYHRLLVLQACISTEQTGPAHVTTFPPISQ